MSNKVIKGDYSGYIPYSERGKLWLTRMFKRVELSPANVESYEVIDESSQTSASSAALRGGAGALLLEYIGLAAAFTARQKGIYTVIVSFKDGKQSVVEFKEKEFKTFKMLFI